MPSQDTFVVVFKEVGGKQVQDSFTKINKAAGLTTTTTQKLDAATGKYATTTKYATTATNNLANKLVYLAAKYLVMTVAIRAAIGAMQGLGRWTLDTARMAIDANESWNLINVTFGDLKKNLDDWARSSSATILQTTRQAEQQAAKFFLVAQSMGAARGEAFELSKKLTVLAQDLSSFRNIEPEAAFQAVYRGIIGQPRLLLSAGVGGMGVNEVASEAMRMGLVKTKGELGAYSKMIARVSLLTRALSMDTGDVVRTQYEMANALRVLNASYRDMRERVGEMIGSNRALGGVVIGVADAMDTLTAAVMGVSEASASLTKINIGAWGASAAMTAITVAEALTVTARAAYAVANPFFGGGKGAIEDITGVHDTFSQMRSDIMMGFFKGAIAQVKGDVSGTGGGKFAVTPGGRGGGGGGKAKKGPKGRSMWDTHYNMPSSGMMGALGAVYMGNLIPGFMNAPWNNMASPGEGFGGTSARWSQMFPGMNIGRGRFRAPGGTGAAGWGMAGIRAGEWWRGLPGTDDAFGGRDVEPGQMPSWFGGRRARGKYDLRNIHFGQEDWATVASAGISGGAGGALGALGSIAGGAFGPIGGLLGGLLGGGLGRLFHKKKQDAGLTPSQPLYTKDVNLSEMLNELLNVTKIAQLRGAGRGIDSIASGVRMQYARAGV